MGRMDYHATDQCFKVNFGKNLSRVNVIEIFFSNLWYGGVADSDRGLILSLHELRIKISKTTPNEYLNYC